MIFSSFPFFVFILITFSLYWVVDYFTRTFVSQQGLRLCNGLLLVISYVFYAYWDWRFLGLLAGISVFSWGMGVLIAKAYRGGQPTYSHKIFLWIAVCADLLTLAFFKYFNFFVSSFCQVFGYDSEHTVLHLILPFGISFFIFQAVAYVVDIYRGHWRQESSIGDSLLTCLLYIGFFPKLLAGPIERPSHLIPQIQKHREFNNDLAINGCRQFLWGLFKKIVVADNCAVYVDSVYTNYAHQSGSTLLLAAILYTIQIYGDFSGYSDMAIGTAKLFGFRFRDNFLFPYFSRNMGEFWKRWHISLNTWFVDYVYIPLGGSRCGKARMIANTMIIFLFSGLWHGADWSFVCWGGYHGLLLVILIICGWNTKYEQIVAYNRCLPTWKELCQMCLVFCLATLGWMMFRADNMSQFVGYSTAIFSNPSSLLVVPYIKSRLFFISLLIYIFFMFFMEWHQRKSDIVLSDVFLKSRWLRWGLYIVLLFLVLIYNSNETSFVYFQF